MYSNKYIDYNIYIIIIIPSLTFVNIHFPRASSPDRCNSQATVSTRRSMQLSCLGLGRWPFFSPGRWWRSFEIRGLWMILAYSVSFDHVMIIFNLIFMLVLWVKTPPQFGLKCAEICIRFSVTRTWEISD